MLNEKTSADIFFSQVLKSHPQLKLKHLLNARDCNVYNDILLI